MKKPRGYDNITMNKITKSDIIVSLIIGETAGWLFLIVLKNLGQTMPKINILPLWIWPIFFPVFCLAWLVFAWLIAKKIKVFYELAKFVLVGGLNFLVNIGVLNLLIFIASIASGPAFSVFKGTSFIAAVINSYLFNKFWTFGAGDKKEAGKEFISFFIVSLIGFVINNVIASLIVNWIGPQWGVAENVWANIGAIVAAFTGMSWNFIGYKFFVFKK